MTRARRVGLRRTGIRSGRSTLNAVSDKERARQAMWRKVKAAVKARAMGRCETLLDVDEVRLLVWNNVPEGNRMLRVGERIVWRCTNPGTDGAHVRKPRNQHHHPECVLWLCRACHDWMDFGVPSDARGRLMATPTVDCRSEGGTSAGGGTPEAHPVAPRTWVTRQTKWERRQA